MTLKTACPKPPVSPPPAKPRRVKRVNKKRKASEFARCYHSKERVEWIKAQPCAIGAVGWSPLCEGPVENAHTEGGGMGRKADYTTIVPLCQLHHRLVHSTGTLATVIVGAMNITELAERTEAAWQAFSASQSHISEREGRAK